MLGLVWLPRAFHLAARSSRIRKTRSHVLSDTFTGTQHSTITQIISPPVEPMGGDTAVTELLAAGSATGNCVVVFPCPGVVNEGQRPV